MSPEYKNLDRFEIRMEGILEPKQIQMQNSMAMAHRITSKEDAEDFLKNPEKYLRGTDTPAFHEMVRKDIKDLMASDIDNHVMCKYLNGHHVSSLAGETTFWDIKLEKELGEEVAETLFAAYNILQTLPPEAHKIIFPIGRSLIFKSQ